VREESGGATDQRVSDFFDGAPAPGRSPAHGISRWTGSLIWLGVAAASGLVAAWAAYTFAAWAFGRSGSNPPVQQWERVWFGSMELLVLTGALFSLIAIGVAAWKAVRAVRRS
jgi:hypothetical protein